MDNPASATRSYANKLPPLQSRLLSVISYIVMVLSCCKQKKKVIIAEKGGGEVDENDPGLISEDWIKKGSSVRFNQNSDWKQLWDNLIILLVLYTIVVVPFELGFQTTQINSPPDNYYFQSQAIEVIDSLTDLCFMIDVFIAFNTSIFVAGHEITSSRYIALRYLSTYFFFDLVSCIPFDNLAFWFSGGSFAATFNQSGKTNLSILKALKVPRLLRISKLFAILENLSIAVYWRIGRLILMVLFIVHLLAAIMGAMIESPDSVLLHEFSTVDSDNWVSRYIICFQSCAATMFGGTLNPTTSSERLLEIVCIFAGVATNAGVVGSITMIIASVNSSAMDYRSTMDIVNETLRYLKADNELVDDVRNFFDFSYGVYRSAKGPQHAWFDLLSPGLRRRVLATKYTEVVKSVPLFANASAAFINVLLPNMVTELHIPGELIIINGSKGAHMYIVNEGVCSAQRTDPVSHDVEVYGIVKAGGFFGEIALLEDNCKRTCDVESITYTDLSVLSKNGLESAFKDFPEQKAFFKMVSELRNNNAEHLPITAIIDIAREKLHNELRQDEDQEVAIKAHENRRSKVKKNDAEKNVSGMNKFSVSKDTKIGLGNRSIIMKRTGSIFTAKGEKISNENSNKFGSALGLSGVYRNSDSVSSSSKLRISTLDTVLEDNVLHSSSIQFPKSIIKKDAELPLGEINNNYLYDPNITPPEKLNFTVRDPNHLNL